MLPRFWQNPFSRKVIFSTALMGLCFISSVQAQSPTTPPKSSRYPGILKSFESLIQIDSTKIQNKKDQLTKSKATTLNTTNISSVEMDVDYMNSIILHSNPGYLKLALRSKCGFYDTLINELLRSSEGKISELIITYLDKNNQRVSAVISKKEFISKVVTVQCPETVKLISDFQVKNLDQTVKSTTFEIPTGIEQCQSIHGDWLKNPQTPYYCNISDFIREAKLGEGDIKDLAPRKALAKVLEKKIPKEGRDFLEKLCSNLHQPLSMCQDFLGSSFWNRLMNTPEQRYYASDICKRVMGTIELSDAAYRQCLARLNKEPDLCQYPIENNRGLSPAPQCDTLSTALNHTILRADYQDCPATSDQQGVTNLSRILLKLSGEKIPPTNGPCSVVSSGSVLNFNKQFNNEENWKLEACYEDQAAEKEKCFKTFFGNYGNLPESYNLVVANILRQTRGADSSIKCEMVSTEEYNPLLLKFKSGCFIIYERGKCFISNCKHKILYNDRTIDFIKIKNKVTLDYFPVNVETERFSQHYLITKDYRKSGRTINNLSSIKNFYKKHRKGIIHGVGCAEDLMPTFFKSKAINSCTPLPFIIDGIISEKGNSTLVTRSGADSLQAPRLISWSNVYSAVKSYQRIHPLRLWTLYALD